MTKGEHAWRATAEINRARRGGDSSPGLLAKGIDEYADGGATRSVLIERTVGADPVAERNMEVEEQALRLSLKL